MNHNREKRYFEFLAKDVLETFFPTQFSDIRLQDCPDLMNFDGTGIEVTRAMLPNAGESNGLFEIMRDKPLEKTREAVVSKSLRLGNTILLYNGKVAASVSEAVVCTLSEIKSAFTNKLKKTNSYSQSISLFIFSPERDYYEPKMIEDFTEWAITEQNSHSHGFSIVYIYQSTKLFLCDLVTGSVEEITLDRAKIRHCIKNALAYADGKMSL